LLPRPGKNASSISRKPKLLRLVSSCLPPPRQPRIPPPPPEPLVHPGILEGLTPPLIALVALAIAREIEAAVEATHIDDIHLVTTLIVAVIAPGTPRSDLATGLWRRAVAIATSAISVRSAAIDPQDAAVVGRLAEEGGIETVIASASVKEIDLVIVIASGKGPDLGSESSTSAAMIVAAIEVEIGIVVVTAIVLDGLDTLAHPPVDAHARGLAIGNAVENATVRVHVHDLLLRDGAPVLDRTRDEGPDLVADHPHGGLLPSRSTLTATFP